MKMNPGVKKAWLRGLRSGRYRQGNGCLRSKEWKHCCLGILCELYHDDHPISSEWFLADPDNLGWNFAVNGDDDFSSLELPREVYLWAGVDGFNPEIVTLIDREGEEVTWTASMLNDDESGFTFDRIADMIDHFL